METENRTYNYLENFVDERRANGRYCFTLNEVRERFQFSAEAIKKSIQRLGKKRKIVQLRQGFYIIVPPEYNSRGIIPPSFFIPDLMKFSGRDYYVGLLNAASFLGAGHQQPQEYFVITTAPTLRPILNHSIKINFIRKKDWDTRFVTYQKTESGYLKISTPELTALDLIFYQERAGGFNRVSTILEELSNRIKPNSLRDCAKEYHVISVIQRLGFLLECVLGKNDLVKPMKRYLHQTKHYPLLFNASTSFNPDLHIENDWKIIMNTSVEPDI